MSDFFRDVFGITTLNDTAVVRYGQQLLDEVKELFYIVSDKEKLDDEGIKELLEAQSFQIVDYT